MKKGPLCEDLFCGKLSDLLFHRNLLSGMGFRVNSGLEK